MSSDCESRNAFIQIEQYDRNYIYLSLFRCEQESWYLIQVYRYSTERVLLSLHYVESIQLMCQLPTNLVNSWATMKINEHRFVFTCIQISIGQASKYI
jgi:hypothetical protein